VPNVIVHIGTSRESENLEKSKFLIEWEDNCMASILVAGERMVNELEREDVISPRVKLNSIYHSDCVDLMKTMDENSVDLTVTSPPYDELRHYNGYSFNVENIASSLYRVTKEGGVVVWVVGDKIVNGDRTLTSFRQALLFQDIGFNAHDIMVYKKKNTPFMRINAYTNCFEFMFVFSKGSPKTANLLKVKTVRQGLEMLPFNKGPDGINKKILKELKQEKTRTNIWEYAVGLGGTTNDKIAFKHPALFPERLAEDHILTWTNEGDLVFDPMCGSGTTCKMALVNRRIYIGCDISKEYVDLTEARLKTVKCKLI
jgi:DNA modification methylase